jgi:hypothetical protein
LYFDNNISCSHERKNCDTAKNACRQKSISHKKTLILIILLNNKFLFVAENHQVLNNIISDNGGHDIIYRSTPNTKDTLSVIRNKILGNGDSILVKPSTSTGAVFIEIKDKSFLLSNNHIAGNKIGGVYLRTETSDGQPFKGRKSKESWIYGNTFLQNGKEAIYLVSNKGIASDVVYIKNNSLLSNYGKGYDDSKHSIVKVKDVFSQIEGNFFFNNSGLVIMEYGFSNKDYKGLQCIKNTFYLNFGTSREYGATIRTNGPIQYHSNNLKNPYNLYEMDTTLSAVTDPVNATMNWFGFGLKPTVKSRLRDNDVDYRLPKALFEPFVRIQPRNILSCEYLVFLWFL